MQYTCIMPKTSPAPVSQKIVFCETRPCCHKGWGPLLRTDPFRCGLCRVMACGCLASSASDSSRLSLVVRSQASGTTWVFNAGGARAVCFHCVSLFLCSWDS